MEKEIHSRIPRINGLTARNPLQVGSLGAGKIATKSSNCLVPSSTKLGKFAPHLLRATANRPRPGVLNLTQTVKHPCTTHEVSKSSSNENLNSKKYSGSTRAMANGDHDEECEMLVNETISLVGSTDHLVLQDDELALDTNISHIERFREEFTPDHCDVVPINGRTQVFHSTFDVSHNLSSPITGLHRVILNSTPQSEELPHLTFNMSSVGDQRTEKNPLQLTYEVPNETGKSAMNIEDMQDNIISDKGSNEMFVKSESDKNHLTNPKDSENTLVEVSEDEQQKNPSNSVQSQSIKSSASKPRFSFGLDLTDCTLDCSIELCDVSIASSDKPTKSPITSLHKQNSFEIDESLGILTPDQMKEFLDSNNLELPLAQTNNSQIVENKVSMHHCRIDQTPSPEELPLDPVAIKTDTADIVLHPSQSPHHAQYQETSQTDSDPKTDQMTKSVASKVSVSFITSVTSITSLDTGYQGDGEMSRPASRGADHSPLNGPRAKAVSAAAAPEAYNAAVPRRQDPMTDSDFFTESDADDIYHHQRGDRRAQVIDGQLYGPSMQAANVYIHQPQQGDDSCMESSGVFTDVENRGDDDFIRRCVDNDMSPEGSTDTVQSSDCNSQKKISPAPSATSLQSNQQNILKVVGATRQAEDLTIDTNNIQQNDVAHLSEAIAETRGLLKSANSSDKDSDKTLTTASVRSVKKVSPNRKHIKCELNCSVKTREIRRSNTVGISQRSPNMRSNQQHDVENQENKMPKKNRPPNKWDGVMNKIAEGKSSGKTKVKINEVKSKVVTGLSRGGSMKIASTTDNLEQSSPKRPILTVKRGRTYSKDSQQSSLSDLSVTGGSGSPRMLSKPPILSRTTKKRDVRTISTSPNEFGPPSKTITGKHPNIRSTSKVNNAPQKRTSPTIVAQQSLPAHSPDVSNKGSPPAKRMVQRRQQSASQSPAHAKASHKDHNQLVSAVPLTAKTVTANNQKVASGVSPQESPSGITKNSSSVAGNELAENYQTQLPNEIHKNPNVLLSNRGFEALGVVIQYLAHNLDAFSISTLKQNYEKTTGKLLETKSALDETRTMCQELEERLTAQKTCEKELRDEKNQMDLNLQEVQNRFRSIVAECEEERTKHDVEIKEAKLRETNLEQRINELTITENELRDKVVASEEEFGEKLRLAALRERELHEKNNQLQRQLDEIKVKAKAREREFEEKISNFEEKVHLLQDEIMVVRQTRTNSVTSTTTEAGGSMLHTLQRTTSCGNHAHALQDEVESLRCVLELKQSEISELRKQNQELQRSADELSATMIKLSAMESRVEDLQVQLEAKINEEKDLVVKNKTLQDSYTRELKNCSRLVLHNEELQWKLKHNSEKFAKTITELSKSYDTSTCSSTSTPLLLSSTRRDPSRTNDGDQSFMDCFEMEDVSPPTSPVMKGIVEKSDSVSWVLEIQDESAEALASRVVRRAGSFRASSVEKQQQNSMKRAKCQASPTNALSQSSSAASILHQNQCETPRVRSKSVSHRVAGRNLARSNSVQTPCSSRLDWQKANFTSTPFSRKDNPNSGNNGSGSPPKESKKKLGNLITCDSSALTPRCELAPRLQLPTQSSIHDLQNLHPKEAAGEAMVSGSNSEDETSSIESSSAASLSCGEESSSNSASPRNRRLAMGKFMMQRIDDSFGKNSRNHQGKGATPIEVAWSQDGDQYPSESIA